MKTRSSKNTNTLPFSIHKGDDGLFTISLHDSLRDALAEDYGFLGYIAADENAHIARLKSRFGELIGCAGQEYLSRLATGVEGEGVVLFTNLPFEQVDWSPLPGMPAHTAKDTSLSEHLLLAISAFFGDAYGVRNEGYRLVNDLIPSRADLEKFTGNGSRQNLGLHTENAALRFAAPGRDFSPKFLMLTGVSKQRVGGPTTPVAIAARAVALLSEETKSLLRTKCARIGLPERQRTLGGGQDEVGPVPVIIGPEGKEEVIAAFYGDMMRPTSPEAAAALKELETALNQIAVKLEVLPGTLAYIANGRALHGRSNFEPVFDENDRTQRWLQRVFGTGRLDAFWECRQVTDRVIDIDLSSSNR